MKVGFIGLGAMGVGMASNIAKAGLLTAIYNRTQDKANIFAAEWNIQAYSSVQELAEQANCLLLCVSADEDVLHVVSEIATAIKPGAIVVDMSTVSMDTAKKAAAILSGKQVGFIDAPVSGGVEGAENGTLAMMVGGDKGHLNTVRPVLETMSRHIEHMGGVGSGQGTKAVNQIMAAGINQAVTDALAFGQEQGLAMDKVIDIISGGAAGNWFLQHRGLNMTKGSFAPGFKLALHHKDLKICQQMADQSELSLTSINQTLSDYEALMAKGHGNEDISALFRLKSKKKF